MAKVREVLAWWPLALAGVVSMLTGWSGWGAAKWALQELPPVGRKFGATILANQETVRTVLVVLGFILLLASIAGPRIIARRRKNADERRQREARKASGSQIRDAPGEVTSRSHPKPTRSFDLQGPVSGLHVQDALAEGVDQFLFSSGELTDATFIGITHRGQPRSANNPDPIILNNEAMWRLQRRCAELSAELLEFIDGREKLETPFVAPWEEDREQRAVQIKNHMDETIRLYRQRFARHVIAAAQLAADNGFYDDYLMSAIDVGRNPSLLPRIASRLGAVSEKIRLTLED